MSNIRPIGDPSIANAMVATFQSIDAARSAPSGLSQTRWRILQCIAKAAPMTVGFDLASGPDIAVEALVRVGEDGTVQLVKILSPLDPADVPACMRPDCMPPIHSLEEARNELLARKSRNRREDDRARAGDGHPRGRTGRTEAAHVAPRRVHRTAEAPRPARPDRLRVTQTEVASSPAKQVNEAQPLAIGEASEHGRGGAAVARPHQGAERCDRVAPDRISGVGPDASQVRVLPPANPPKFTNWIEERARRLDGAIRFLKSQAILVSVVDRDAQVRQYFVAGKRDRKFAEEVIEIAIEKGWAE